eukprot:CAMPEP_0181373684 /NCGR_PEP_ID=MMETSP1106-20121128/15535_1 /TAXON_ID=81844 /ORGANISM="Mantoniella antarctica, Strain SL-175" /LENGTH=467 /DNA_ID=CAMNT_0023491449 /DNA_START=29 /DNA_END=1432 /DNA_ORIENTATION=-
MPLEAAPGAPVAGTTPCFRPFDAGYDAKLLPKPQLEAMVVDTFRSFNLVGSGSPFNISTEALAHFVAELRSMYNDRLDFHNFHHAFTVFAVTAEIVREVLAAAPGGAQHQHPPLRPIHVLAILLAALCHDVDHPGLSNAFLNSTRAPPPSSSSGDTAAAAGGPHPLAVRYGDATASVVEAHHVELTTRLLSAEGGGEWPRAAAAAAATTTAGATVATSGAPPSPSEGLLNCMKGLDAAYTMELVTHAVMGTDLAVHKQLSEKLQMLGEVLGLSRAGAGGSEQTPAETPAPSEETAEELAARVKATVGEDFHHVVVQAVMHAADLSNPTMHFDTCAAWSLRLTAEFAAQARREADWKEGTAREETAAAGTATGSGGGYAAGGVGSGGGGVGGDGSVGAAATGEDCSARVAHLREKLKPIAKGETWFVENMILPYWTRFAEVYPPLQHHVARIRETLDTYAAIAAEHAA